MPPRSARRLGVLSTTLLLTVGLLAPTAASAAPPTTSDAAATLGARGSAFDDRPQARASATDDIVVRDLSYSCPSGRVPRAGFTDVPSSYTFTRSIDCLVWYGVTQGKTATSYAPNGSVTRQQMAVFIHRTLGYLGIADLVEPPARSQFRDVPATGEVGEAVNVLASDELAELLGIRIVSGKTETTYAPAERVTRAQMGSFINRLLEGVAAYNGATIEQGSCDVSQSDPNRGCFPDEASIPATHRPNVASLYRFGIVTGRADGTYGPSADVTRAQMSAFLMRLMDLFVESEFVLPPDRYTDIHVDRGTETSPCTPSGRDGSPSAPYCTIQAGLDAARALSGHAVSVLVRDRTQPYAEDVVVSTGSAFTVDLFPARGELVPLTGSIRIDGDEVRDFNVVAGFEATAPSGPAFDVRTAGSAVIFGSAAVGDVGVYVDQTGRTALMISTIAGETLGVDLARTMLRTDGEGTGLLYNEFGPVTDAYVRAPSGTSSAIGVNLADWQELNDFATATELGQHSDRQAILPAS